MEFFETVLYSGKVKIINLFRIINFSFVCAGRVQPEDNIKDYEKSMYGFYWWFWKPTANNNGERFLDPEKCFGCDFMFLCFSFGFILWPIFNHPEDSIIRKMYGK